MLPETTQVLKGCGELPAGDSLYWVPKSASEEAWIETRTSILGVKALAACQHVSTK